MYTFMLRRAYNADAQKTRTTQKRKNTDFDGFIADNPGVITAESKAEISSATTFK